MMRIRARVTSGLGKGGKFIAIPLYEEIFERILGKRPFHGTLNLEVDSVDAVKVGKAFMEQGMLHDGLEWDGKKMGAIETLSAVLWIGTRKLKVSLVRPALTEHHREVIEVVSDLHLRQEFGLEDGDEVDLEVAE